MVIMDWKKKCCSCTLNLRLALDVLQIILCSIIHFAMEGTGFYQQENSTHYQLGEFIWFVVINTLGFVAQIVVLIKVLGCTLPSHFMRLYYITCSLLLLCVATIITAIAYATQPDPECNTTSGNPSKKCTPSNASMSASKFGTEFAMFILTAIAGSLYIYSFILTFCKPKLDTGNENANTKNADENAVCDDRDNTTSWFIPEHGSNNDNTNRNMSAGDKESATTATPSAPPTPFADAE